MQTFLPYPSFEKSMACLDYRRLGKQRVEAYSILRILRGEVGPGSWKNHPAVLMWKGYEAQLWNYGVSACREWISRGYKDTILRKLYDIHGDYESALKKNEMPPWFGRNKFHGSHRSNLLRKDFEFYKKYKWDERPGLPYVWPVKKDGTGLDF